MHIVSLVVVGLMLAVANTETADDTTIIDPQTRIVGGQKVDIIQHPYQVAVYSRFGMGLCGGSIIGESWILTAAHCLNDRYLAYYTIRAGSSHHATGGATRQVKRMIKHEKYRDDTMSFDFGLIELTQKLKFSSRIRSVQLPQEYSMVPDGTAAIVSGWGLLNEDSRAVIDKLRAVTVRTVSQKLCVDNYSILEIAITEDMFCAGDEGKDACSGDSGGPLTVNGVLVGVVSWGYGCAWTEFPGVYGRVSVVRNWIKEHSRI